MKKSAKVRLYIAERLTSGQSVTLNPSQSHYLANVLRLTPGEEIKVFDNYNGEYSAEISEIRKKDCIITIGAKLRGFTAVPDIWLLFAPVKKDKTDFIIASATELGCRKIIPVITKRTISERIKKERFEAQVIEAAEQCRRVDLPEVGDAVSLEQLLKGWDKKRILYFMDETGDGADINTVFSQAPKNTAAAILVGPEGGFDERELETLRRLEYARGVSMGARILRAETAVAASLACWQAIAGDWTSTATED